MMELRGASRDSTTMVDQERSNILFARRAKPGRRASPYLTNCFGVHRDDRDPDPARRYKMTSFHRLQFQALKAIRGTEISGAGSAWRPAPTAFTGSSSTVGRRIDRRWRYH
jgi:hypothetical protein